MTQAIRAFALCSLTALSACGTVPPQIPEAWETREIDNDMEFRIKKSIFCEIIHAIRDVNRHYRDLGIKIDVIPPDYGVQLQTTLTVEESTAFNPSLTYNRTLANASVAGVTVGQIFNLAGGATVSSDASRIDTSYSYYVVGRIAGEGKNREFCDDPVTYPIDRHGSSPLLQSDLGIERFLVNASKASDILPSSRPAKDKKDLKLDVYSYEVKFVVVTNGSINPTWKLVSVSADTGALPFLAAARTRTHDLLLTFGPNSAQGFAVALQQHFTTQIAHSTPTGVALQ